MNHLTIPQNNIWALQEYYKDTAIANLCGSMTFSRHIDRDVLSDAINQEFKTQTGLRLHFVRRDGEIQQYVAEYERQFFPFEAFSDEDALQKYAEELAGQPFQLIDSGLARFALYEINGVTGFIACLHHLIADAWSFSELGKHILACCDQIENHDIVSDQVFDYRALIQNEDQYFDSERYRRDESYWRGIYDQAPASSSIKPAFPVSRAPESSRYISVIERDQRGQILRFCEEYDISPAILFQTAVLIYLKRINPDGTSVTIGIPVLNRSGFRDKETVGMFVSTLPFTISFDDAFSVKELCNLASEKQYELLRHQRYPHSYIMKFLRDNYHLTELPYDTVVSYQNADIGISGSRTDWYSNGYSNTAFELHIDDRDKSDCFTLTLDYRTDLFCEDEEISLLIDRLVYIIEQMIKEPDSTVSKISILPQSEYERVIFECNQTDEDYPSELCIHQIFEEEVKKHPDKTAIIFRNENITYCQLNNAANHFAKLLKEKGVCTGDIVAIISHRDWRYIAAMLGILKTGAAYMPIDPESPKERTKYMISQSSASAAIVDDMYYGEFNIPLIIMRDVDNEIIVNNPENQVSSDDLCYVIFTSGSTGKPKGAKICHRGVVNFAYDAGFNHKKHCSFCDSDPVVLAFITLTFDGAAHEWFISLLNGLTVVMADDRECLSAARIADLIHKYHIEVIASTPTRFMAMMRDDGIQHA
ncbi:MAG: AMP-binding protein, partial [Lachnospiraceae bacterium]|nr:AMP-binding protein [Lachnospiraceae bacterium]